MKISVEINDDGDYTLIFKNLDISDINAIRAGLYDRSIFEKDIKILSDNLELAMEDFQKKLQERINASLHSLKKDIKNVK